jgi:branched-chain amino acid aminotransferase
MPVDEARIPVTDDGLLRGDGVFEVMRLYHGVPYGREAHLRRMANSAGNLRLELDVAGVERDIDALLDAAQPDDAILRALVTRGGHRIVLIEPMPSLPESVSLTCIEYAPVRLLDGVKSLSYAANMLASRLAVERGFDEALLVTPHGRVLELPTASFFWVRGGEVMTPPLTDHVLDSITRRLVFEVAEAREVETSRDDLASADEAFVASSVREVMRVRAIDELELPADGPITRGVAERVAARIAADLSRD